MIRIENFRKYSKNIVTSEVKTRVRLVGQTLCERYFIVHLVVYRGPQNSERLAVFCGY